MNMIIAGHGKLAAVIALVCKEKGVKIRIYEPGMKLPKSWKKINTVAVHAGSGRQLRRLVKFCTDNHITLIQASGGMEKRLPRHPKVAIVDAPNLAMSVVAFIRNITAARKSLERQGIVPTTITETHQKLKKTVPATALKMAELLGLPTSSIHSNRSDHGALSLGVETQHLDGHGHHFLNFIGTDGVVIQHVVRVNGRRPYGEGAVTLGSLCLKPGTFLQGRFYTVEGIVDLAGM